MHFFFANVVRGWILWGKATSIVSVKLKLYKSRVKPILLYGYQRNLWHARIYITNGLHSFILTENWSCFYLWNLNLNTHFNPYYRIQSFHSKVMVTVRVLRTIWYMVPTPRFFYKYNRHPVGDVASITQEMFTSHPKQFNFRLRWTRNPG